MAKLGDVFSLQITGEWGSECDTNQAGTKILRTTNFTSNGTIDYSNIAVRKIAESKIEKKRLKKGDIILEKSGGTEKTPVGRVVFCDKAIENDIYLCNNFTQAMRVNPAVAYPRYVFYFMWYLHYSGKTDLLQNKTTGIRNLRVKSYLDEKIPLPSLDEQRRIAVVLDKISDLIALRRAQLDKLDLLVKSRFVEMFGDPVLNPLGWRTESLKDVCIKLTDGTHFSPDSFEAGDYKYITAKNIKVSGFDFTNITYVSEEVHRPIYERCNPELGDVLYIKDGVTTGIAMVNTLDEEFSLLSSVALLKQDRQKINGYFLAALLNNENMYTNIRRNMGGAAITRLTIAKLNIIPIILPPIELQNQFSFFVEKIEKSKLTIHKSLDKLEILKQAIMQRYFK